MQFKNRSVVNGYDDLNIDFKENLEVRDSITFKNCKYLSDEQQIIEGFIEIQTNLFSNRYKFNFYRFYIYTH